MQNLKYKALSIAMAVMTAASPVLSSYTAYASDNVADNIVVNDDGTVSQTFNLEDNNDDSSEEKETKFLFLNLKTTGGKAIISEGKDQEQTIRLDEKQDGSEYIDVYDQNGLLISSENAAENAYMYVYEAEADNIVSVKAEADDGYVINLYELVDDDTSKPEETGFDEKVTSFMYPTFVDADKTITIGFEKTETPEDDITVEEVKTEDKKDTQEDLADDLTVNDEKSEDGETDGEEDKTENDLSGDLTVNDTVEDVDKTADAEGTGTETEGTEAGSETAEDDADADDKMGDLTVNDDIGIDGSSSEDKAVVDGEEGDGTTESIEEETDPSVTTSNEGENEDELLNDSNISTELVTGDEIDEEKELAADEAKSDTEGDIADEEGYPSCASYIYKTEAVAKKDKYFDINTYSEYENTNIEVVSVDGNTDQQTWNDDDSFTVVYKESLKDNPDYYWNKEVKFVVVEDADMATAKSSECDNILPDWAPIGDADGVGVPELAGTVLQGKTYNVLVNDTSWNPDVVTNGYDISRFRMSTTGDLGDFDVSKPGSYTLRYVVSYFTLPKYRWYVDTTINVVDHLDGHSVMVEGLKPGRYYLQESKRNPGTVQNTNTYYFDIIAGKTINKFTNVETGNSGTAVANNPFRLTGKMFSKTDPNGRPLSGATFKVVYSPLEPEDGYNPMYTWYFETDSNGEVLYDSNHYVSNFNGSWSDDPLKLDDGTWAIPSGSLWVTEVKAPAGYKIDTQTHSIKLTGRLDSNGVYTIPDLEAEDLTIIEYPDGWNVDLMTKKMDAADGTPLSDAVFGIYSDRNCNNLIARLKSDIDGYTGTYRMEFDGGVNSTTVYCREIKAPEGYQRNDTIYHLTLTKANDDGQTRMFGENGINGLGVYDEKVSEKWKLRYRVKKVDGNGKPIEGVVFDVYDNSDCVKPIATLETNSNGYSDIELIKDIETSIDSYTLYCKEYSAPAGYIFDSTKKYTLTWNRSTYDALKNRGDESGELQTFGGDKGIVNLTPTATPTPIITQPVTPSPSNTPTPTPTSTPTPTPTNTPTPTPTNTPTPTPTPIPTPTDEPPTPGTGYVYVKKTSRAGQDLMDLDGYSLKGGKFSVTGGGFTGTLTTEENGISNHLQLPNNAYQTAVANDYEDTGRAVVDETTIAPLDDAIATDETSDETAYTDMEDVDTTSDSISDDVVNTNNTISEDVDALLDTDYSDSSDEVIDNIDEYTGDDEGIANMALNPKITSYKVTEIEAPLGHNNYGVTKSFSVTMPQDKDRVIEVQFSDDPKVLDSRMTIKKLSAKGNPISGTIFKVEYIDDFNGNSDNVKRTWYLQSDANGIVRFDDNHVVTSLTQYRSDEFFKFNNNIVLPYYGQLRFTEVSTPASYVLNSEPFVVNLADAQNGSTVDLSKTVYNDLEPAKVQLTKYKDDGSPLAGVEFELKFVKESETATKNKSESFSRLLNVGETATATTDADGKITWENLDQGDYEIRETKTVDGCALLTDVIKITLPLQLTKDEADSYGNVNKDLAKEDTNYTKKWYFFDCKYEIKNNQVFLMPMTGSDGTWMYGFVGFVAIAFTGCLYLLLGEKKKNKRKHRRKRK